MNILLQAQQPGQLGIAGSEASAEVITIDLSFLLQLLFQVLALMAVVYGLDGLLEADGDKEADADGGDVDEEVAPGVDGFVGGVDVEQGGSGGVSVF